MFDQQICCCSTQQQQITATLYYKTETTFLSLVWTIHLFCAGAEPEGTAGRRGFGGEAVRGAEPMGRGFSPPQLTKRGWGSVMSPVMSVAEPRQKKKDLSAFQTSQNACR